MVLISGLPEEVEEAYCVYFGCYEFEDVCYAMPQCLQMRMSLKETGEVDGAPDVAVEWHRVGESVVVSDDSVLFDVDIAARLRVLSDSKTWNQN